MRRSELRAQRALVALPRSRPLGRADRRRRARRQPAQKIIRSGQIPLNRGDERHNGGTHAPRLAVASSSALVLVAACRDAHGRRAAPSRRAAPASLSRARAWSSSAAGSPVWSAPMSSASAASRPCSWRRPRPGAGGSPPRPTPTAATPSTGCRRCGRTTRCSALPASCTVPLDDKAEIAYSSVVMDGKLVPFVQPTAESSSRRSSTRVNGRRWALGWTGQEAARAGAARRAGGLTPELEAPAERRRSATGSRRLRLPGRVSEWIRLTIECELATDWDELLGVDRPGRIRLLSRARASPTTTSAAATPGSIAALVDAIPGRKTLLGDGDRHRALDDARRATRARGSRTCAIERLETVEAERVILAVPFVRLHQIQIDPPLSERSGRRSSASTAASTPSCTCWSTRARGKLDGARTLALPGPDRRPARRGLRRGAREPAVAAAGGVLAADPRRRGGARFTWSRAR